jgi:hypothetical protein
MAFIGSVAFIKFFWFIIRGKIRGITRPKKGQQCGDISQKVGNDEVRWIMVEVFRKIKKRGGNVRFPPLGGYREGFCSFEMLHKPLPATTQSQRPLPEEGIKNSFVRLW